MKNAKHQVGISMVEVLVAMVISLFLLGGIIQVYIGNKTSYRFSNSVSRIQENGRFAMDTLAIDLRMAGFFGCAIFDPEDTSNIVNNLNPAGPGYNENGFDWLGQGLVQGTDNDGLNGSDSITIRGAKPGALNVRPPYNVSTSANIFVDQNESIEVGDIVMVTNCRGADIFQVTNTTVGINANTSATVHNTGAGTAPGNYNPDSCKGANAHCLSQTYGSDASMIELQVVTYDIRAGASGEPALFRKVNSDAPEELIDGIEQMQVLYGVDTSGDDFPNQYVTLANVADMNDVMAIRLMLLARSADTNVTEGAQTYTFNGATTTSNDGRLRQIFTSTITLRNRVGGAL